MGSKQCFNILSSIKDTVGKITFEDDVRLKELLDMTVTCDQKQLEELKGIKEQVQEEKQEEEDCVSALKDRLQRTTNEKAKVKQKIIALMELQPKEITMGNNGESKKYKKLFDVYSEVTGVYATYRTPENSVRGFVGVKGTTPRESRLLPFDLKASDPEVSDKIWERIAQASAESSDIIDDEVNELSKMHIG